MASVMKCHGKCTPFVPFHFFVSVVVRMSIASGESAWPKPAVLRLLPKTVQSGIAKERSTYDNNRKKAGDHSYSQDRRDGFKGTATSALGRVWALINTNRMSIPGAIIAKAILHEDGVHERDNSLVDSLERSLSMARANRDLN